MEPCGHVVMLKRCEKEKVRYVTKWKYGGVLHDNRENLKKKETWMEVKIYQWTSATRSK